ncbi:MAG: 16S rRNA (cytosine(967)-C(5))-methyltransferase RsmB [Sideroxydans sp.]|nr:16S rRNA (cytosine(967)-C(5))-methyltransferase RsmB [Sideroxydans sp.]
MQNVQLEAAKVVSRVMQGRNLTQVLSESLRTQAAFTAQQRGALQDLCYGTLRYYGQIEQMLSSLMAHPARDTQMQHLLMVAIYQLEYTQAGSHVIVDQAVTAAKRLNPKAGGLVNGVLRNYQRSRDSLLEETLRKDVSRYSYPQWWISTVQRQYGTDARAILEAGNQHPPMTLRVNTRLTTAAEYLALLESQDIAVRRVEPDALILENPVAVERLPKFAQGWVSVQDAGAQFAAHLLDVKAGMRVLDACAAPGGKTAHLLELSDIELVALDKDEVRLQRVRDNLTRLNLKAQIVCGDASTPQDWWDGKTFQRILADVPCSASGVVRRHPDIKWLRRAVDVESFAKQQAQILEALWALLDVKGQLLYATCSLFARENQQVVDAFLAHHPEATQLTIASIPSGQLLPNDAHDGFFYAVLQKNN